MSDIEIARCAKKMPIDEVADKIGIKDKIEMYGCDKAKIRFEEIKKDKKGKLILVTAINPTPYGEGKTTVAIGLSDGLRKKKMNSIAVLREPSLGPVFGIKGGATGGGYAQVVPMEDINLHFTGDFHAITSANNLICAAIDNHLYFGNELDIDKDEIYFNRALDMNDRALRKISLEDRDEKFNITAASEIMSILCLSRDFADLKKRLGNILIGKTKKGKEVFTRDLKLEGSLAVLLKDAIRPNLVQSLENNPVIIHGGPFANIAHGCNSIIATNLGLKLGDYVVTEAGFGSDLGAEKFFDIKCRKANLKPDCVVIVVTLNALIYHAGNLENRIDAIKVGLSNLEAHIDNIVQFTSHVMVTLNKYLADTEEEIKIVSDFVLSKKVRFKVNSVYLDGGDGAISLAEEVIKVCDEANDFKLLYEDDISICDKIDVLAKKIYHAKEVKYEQGVLEKIKDIEQSGYAHYPICVAKTQYSISDDAKKLGYPKDYDITVRDVNVYTGAEFIVVYLGNIMTMPGLSRHANYENIDIDTESLEIKGLF